MSGFAKDKDVWLSKEFEKPLVTASYFGFIPIEAPKISKEELALREEFGQHPHCDPAEHVAFIRSYIESGLSTEPHPISVSYKRCTPGRGADKYVLHFIGSNQGVADAALLRGALSILEDLGHKRLIVHINSLGDKDSLNAYERELHVHVRKFMPNLPENIREEMKQDVFRLFHLEHPDLEEIRETVPPSISFLSIQSRNHLKDVLEYLEALGVEFRISHKLVGNKHCSSHTIFAIRDAEDENKTMAFGYHYGKLGKKAGMKKEITMASVTIYTDFNKSSHNKIYKDLPKPKFSLVHLGREAKMHVLPIIELLRHEHIRVHHLLGKDKITIQLSSAESQPVSHLIIIGQKEALENAATVRNIATRAQETIPIPKLCTYLKHLTI